MSTNNGTITVIETQPPAIDLGSSKDAILAGYYFLLVLGGCIGLPLTLVTMILTKTASRRHPTLINLLLLYFVYAIACLLLLFAGQEKSTAPTFGLCLAQASFNYGSAVGAAAATLCLVLQLWMDMYAIRSAKNLPTVVALVAAPWMLFLVISLSCLIYGARNPHVVTFKWLFYCSLDSNLIVWIVRGSALAILVFLIGFQSVVLYKLNKTSRSIRSVNRSSFTLCARVTIFTIYSVITIGIFLASVPLPNFSFSYIFTASMPLAVFIVFGTQMENLRIWFRMRPKVDKQQELKPIQFKRDPRLAVHINTSTSSWSDNQGQPEKMPKASFEEVCVDGQERSDLESVIKTP